MSSASTWRARIDNAALTLGSSNWTGLGGVGTARNRRAGCDSWWTLDLERAREFIIGPFGWFVRAAGRVSPHRPLVFWAIGGGSGSRARLVPQPRANQRHGCAPKRQASASAAHCQAAQRKLNGNRALSGAVNEGHKFRTFGRGEAGRIRCVRHRFSSLLPPRVSAGVPCAGNLLAMDFF